MLLAIYEQEIFGTRLLTLLLTVRNKADKKEGRFWSVQHVRMQAPGASRLVCSPIQALIPYEIEIEHALDH